MRVPATEITDDLVGRLVVEFSHTGEDPKDDSRRFDQLGHAGGPQQIVAVRHDDTDNHVAVLLGEILMVTWRDDEGHQHRGTWGDDGQPVFTDRGDFLMARTDPPQGRVELGFDENGWIDVED